MLYIQKIPTRRCWGYRQASAQDILDALDESIPAQASAAESVRSLIAATRGDQYCFRDAVLDAALDLLGGFDGLIDRLPGRWAERIYDHYRVAGDPETGIWIGEAELIGTVTESDWLARMQAGDTDEAQYSMCDRRQVEPLDDEWDDEARARGQDTVALEIHWQ